LPFDQFYKAYTTAADDWEEITLASALATQEASYQYFISKKEELSNSESGAFEGNISDLYPMVPLPPLANKVEGRRKAGQAAIVDCLSSLGLKDQWATIVMPQIITLVGNMPIVYTAEGKVDGKAFTSNFKTDWERGLYLFLMLDSRSCYLTGQHKGPAKPYGALVPLILYALRLVQGVPYTAWGHDTIRYVVNHTLAEAMLFETDEWPSAEEIMEGRTRGLTYQTSDKVGTLRNPESTHKLWSTKGTCFEGMPRDLQVMLAQIWVAHPSNRSKYMVLDPKNWDKVPAPLISTELFNPDPKPQQPSNYNGLGSDTPWSKWG
jgi:hypothetical protein